MIQPKFERQVRRPPTPTDSNSSLLFNILFEYSIPSKFNCLINKKEDEFGQSHCNSMEFKEIHRKFMCKTLLLSGLALSLNRARSMDERLFAGFKLEGRRYLLRYLSECQDYSSLCVLRGYWTTRRLNQGATHCSPNANSLRDNLPRGNSQM